MKFNFQELEFHCTDYEHMCTDGSKYDMKVGCAVVPDNCYEKCKFQMYPLALL